LYQIKYKLLSSSSSCNTKTVNLDSNPTIQNKRNGKKPNLTTKQNTNTKNPQNATTKDNRPPYLRQAMTSCTPINRHGIEANKNMNGFTTHDKQNKRQ
jgi:hypothetical protein